MPFIYYCFRKALVCLSFILLFCSCTLFEEEKIVEKRNLWFENNITQLDKIYVLPTLGIGDTVITWLSEEVKILNNYERFCQVVDTVSDSIYRIQFSRSELPNKVFNIDVEGFNVIITYASEDDFFLLKEEVITELRTVCDDLFINTRKNDLLKSGYLKKEFDELKKYHPWSIKIPDDFKIVRHKENFLWIRTQTTKQNSHLIVHRSPYVASNQFDLNRLIYLRDSLAKKNILHKNFDSTAFMETEFYFPITIKDNSHQIFYSKRIDGAWTINKQKKHGFALGDYFVGYAMVDSHQPSNFYY